MSAPQHPKNHSEGLWTAPLVKDFLNAKMWKFDQHPWPGWFIQRGGVEGVFAFVQSCPVPAQLQALFNKILDHPGKGRNYYAEAIGAHPATVSEHFTKLAALLATHLNQWHLEAPPDPPRSPPSNLPAAPNAFIGREVELAAVCGLLRRPDVRLVTLTGPGGIGKTRLALQVARTLLPEFPDGIFFVSLVSVADILAVPVAILQTLAVMDASDRPAQAVLTERLKSKQLLLVLDNFEQLVAAGPSVADLLSVAPYVKVLVTSRALLHLYGEQEFVVPPLTLPDPNNLPSLDAIGDFSAIVLFVERAQAVSRDFFLTNENIAVVVAICAYLDGLPLAIELAAAKNKLFSPRVLLVRLKESLSVLATSLQDIPERHRTINAVISWSYSLLTPLH